MGDTLAFPVCTPLLRQSLVEAIPPLGKLLDPVFMGLLIYMIVPALTWGGSAENHGLAGQAQQIHKTIGELPRHVFGNFKRYGQFSADHILGEAIPSDV